MRRIDVTSPAVAKISPPYKPPGASRGAHFTHKGLFFDAHGREIVAGQPLDAAAEDEDELITPDHTLKPATLLAQRNIMPLARFREEARACRRRPPRPLPARRRVLRRPRACNQVGRGGAEHTAPAGWGPHRARCPDVGRCRTGRANRAASDRRARNALSRLRARAQQILGHGSPVEARDILAALKAELGRCNAERARVMDLERLIAESRVLPFGTLRRQAQVLIGETCPTRGHGEIVAALEAALMIARGGTPPPAAKAVQQPAAAARRKEGRAGDGVNLKAWGAGTIEVPLAKVRETIKAQYGVVVTSRDHAINFLTEAGVIEAADETVEAEVHELQEARHDWPSAVAALAARTKRTRLG